MKNIVLSIDPGKYNFAYSFLTKSGGILETGIFHTTVTDLKDPKVCTHDVMSFVEEIDKICSKYSSYKIRLVFERFVPRNSRYGGNLIEITCLKIGIVVTSLCKRSNILIVPVLASTWKNFFNKNHLMPNNDSVPEHILDAVCIGRYYLIQENKITLKQAYKMQKAIEKVNFHWYKYKGNWFFGKRKKEHLRGQRNSFGN